MLSCRNHAAIQRFCWASWVQLLLLTSQLQHVAAAVPASSDAVSIQPFSTPIVQQSVPARYCPDGGMMEGGLCYKRCKLGWRGLACHCWKGVESYDRGCGTKPAVCHAMSYRKQLLPPVTSRAPFSLVLSADPQLFRVVNKFKNVSFLHHARVPAPQQCRSSRCRNVCQPAHSTITLHLTMKQLLLPILCAVLTCTAHHEQPAQLTPATALPAACACRRTRQFPTTSALCAV